MKKLAVIMVACFTFAAYAFADNTAPAASVAPSTPAKSTKKMKKKHTHKKGATETVPKT